MRAVIQRVTEASVAIEGIEPESIGKGFMVLIGVGTEDGPADASQLAAKISTLRIFEDEAGKMNLALKDVGGEVLAISQFTLFGDCRKGNRPGFTAAMGPEMADKLYKQVVEELRAAGITVKTGVFQADMKVSLINDGPVTMLLDTKKLF